MIDLYLKATTEAELAAAFPYARGTDQDGNGHWITSSHDFCLDPIGPLVITPAVLDEEGNVVNPAVLDDAYHANLRLIDESLLASVPGDVIVNPAPVTPSRVWS